MALAAAIAVFLCTATQARADGKTIDWKPAEQAILRVNNRPVDEWNLFEAGKKTNPLLLKIGTRYLLIDSHRHKVFELAPDSLKKKGDDLYWNTAQLPANPLKTDDWMVRDVGLAYLFRVRLTAEKQVIDLQLPHPVDIRPLY